LRFKHKFLTFTKQPSYFQNLPSMLTHLAQKDPYLKTNIQTITFAYH
jgi:hypothetical protein